MFQSRKSHLKKCSKSLGVGTDRMIQLVKDQEIERDGMLDAGIIPLDIKYVDTWQYTVISCVFGWLLPKTHKK